jgi:hypothetical protein
MAKSPPVWRIPYQMHNLMAIRNIDDHFTDIVQFLSTGMAPSDYTIPQKKQLVVHAADFSLIVGQLYKMGPDEILRRCIMETERPLILAESHEGIARRTLRRERNCAEGSESWPLVAYLTQRC